MFSGKGRNTLRNSTGVFARKDWSNDDAGSSEKALANFGPHISDVGIKKIFTRTRNISETGGNYEIVGLEYTTCGNTRKFVLSSEASED